MATHLHAVPNSTPQSCPSVAAPVLIILRLEGFVVAALSAILYARTGASWWLFAALWVTPDLSMLGYFVNSCWGARIYNAVHTYVTPATLAAAGLVLHQAALLPFALIWINHIAVDRLCGYGLKYPRGFGWTHLGTPGKGKPSTQPSA